MRKKSRMRNLVIFFGSKVIMLVVLRAVVKQAVQEGRAGR